MGDTLPIEGAIAWYAGDQQAQLMALVAAAGGLRPNSTPPPLAHTPPLPSQTPPVPTGTPGPSPAAVSLAANAAALAAAAAGQNGFNVHSGAGNNALLGSLEYQAAYQAREVLTDSTKVCYT